MIFQIESHIQYEKVRKYYEYFREKQFELEDDDTLIYSAIPLNLALKNNILFHDLMLHPKVMKYRKFYEGLFLLNSKKEIVDKISEVLQHELLCDQADSNLSEVTMKKLIMAHKRLSKIRKNK